MLSWARRGGGGVCRFCLFCETLLACSRKPLSVVQFGAGALSQRRCRTVPAQLAHVPAQLSHARRAPVDDADTPVRSG